MNANTEVSNDDMQNGIQKIQADASGMVEKT